MRKKKTELKIAYENMMRKKKIQIHLSNLENRIKHQEKEVSRLSRITNEEEDDVHQLDKLGLQSLFQSILGNKKQELEKQRQEYLLAFLQLQGSEKKLLALRFEKGILEKQLSGLFQAEIEFEKIFNANEKRFSLLLDKKAKDKLKRLELRILNHEERIVEIREAIRAGKKSEKVLTKITSDLSEIKTWGNSFLGTDNMKAYGQGSKAAAKKKFLHHAKHDAQKANILLEHFEVEILDIYKQFKLDYRSYIKDFSRFLELFYDNLITDWVVKQNIKNTSHSIELMHDKVMRILAMLENEILKTKEYIAEEHQVKKSIIVDNLESNP